MFTINDNGDGTADLYDNNLLIGRIETLDSNDLMGIYQTHAVSVLSADGMSTKRWSAIGAGPFIEIDAADDVEHVDGLRSVLIELDIALTGAKVRADDADNERDDRGVLDGIVKGLSAAREFVTYRLAH